MRHSLPRLCFFVFAAAAPVPALVSACGGTVVVDHNLGAGGAGGATDGPATSTSTLGPTSSISSSVSSVSVTTSTSTGPSTCDNLGDCQACIDCSVMGPCLEQVNTCFNDPECVAFNDCINNCFDDACTQQCSTDYPDGAELYNLAVICVICQDCYFSCDGQGSGC